MSDIIHSKKLFDGRQTAREVWAETVLGGIKCPCGLDATVVCKVFWPLDECLKKGPELLATVAAMHGGQVPTIDFTHGKHVRTGMAYSCDVCRPALEKEAAKAPSWAVVEISDGPSRDKAQTTVK